MAKFIFGWGGGGGEAGIGRKFVAERAASCRGVVDEKIVCRI